MARRTEGTVEGDRFSLSEAARLLGLSKAALYTWLKRHGLLRRCPKEGKYRYVNVPVLEYYLAATERTGVERAVVRPQGWVGIYKAAEVAGCSPEGVYRAVQRGQVRAVRVGYINYYCLEDLSHLRLELRNHPLPGWLEVNPFADHYGAHRGHVVTWLRRHGHEVRKYRRPKDGRTVRYALAKALLDWEANYLQRKSPARVEQAFMSMPVAPAATRVMEREQSHYVKEFLAHEQDSVEVK